MTGIIENNIPEIINKIDTTVKKAASFLPDFLDNLYTIGSANAAKTTATNKSKSNDLTLKNMIAAKLIAII